MQIRINRETLSDRSHVYNVTLQDDEGGKVTFPAISEKHAGILAHRLGDMIDMHTSTLAD